MFCRHILHLFGKKALDQRNSIGKTERYGIYEDSGVVGG